MLKAMLIVAVTGMGGDYTAEMPSMEKCLEMRTVIEKQDPDIKTLCVPIADEIAKIQDFFWVFMDMVDQVKREEAVNEFYRLEQLDKECDRCVEVGDCSEFQWLVCNPQTKQLN